MRNGASGNREIPGSILCIAPERAEKLLPVADEGLLTSLAETRTVLLQAAQHDHVAIVHLGPAKTRNVTGAGFAALLGRGGRGHQNQWQGHGNNEKKSGHHICLHLAENAIEAFYNVLR
jgi:hypothetical protein